jgi:hypothetical protein
MRLRVAVLLVWGANACVAVSAQGTWQPAFHLAGSLEHGQGAAFEALDDTPRRDAAASLGFALDGRERAPWGGLDASLFALAHDPTAPADRGLFASARVRLTREWAGGWRLVFDDAAKLQRRKRLAFSDLQRNEAALGLERRASSGRTLGLTLADRRRGVQGAPELGFERQALTASLGLPLGARRDLQVSLGAQRFASDAGRGRRAAFAAELVQAGARGAFALRLGWLEPLSESGLAGATSTPGRPTAERPPGSFLGFGVAPGARASFAPSASGPLPGAPEPSAPAALGLLGEGLLVDPLEGDEDDWDLGRRKQELLALGSWRLGPRLTLVARARLVRQRGPDLLEARGARADVDGAALRVALRRSLSAHADLVFQGAFQARRDVRPGFDYTRSVLALSLELRP